jgi:two-component system alkaline phosphatase synthesis response regulator PhoP
MLTRFLEGEGYAVSQARDGVAGLNLARRTTADVILIDADLPEIDGVTLCGAIRAQIGTPIILLTAGDDELQKVVALDRGADLCMTKPIATGELRARIRSLLRRAARRNAARAQVLAVGDLRVEVQVRRAWRAKAELQLTPKEFDLLVYLMQHRGIVLSRDQLLRDVWHGRVDPRSQTLDVHIRWLRQKIESDPNHPVYIRTVRMIGYCFEGPNVSAHYQ